MKIAIVILNWNTKNFLKKFLPPLLHSVRNVSGAEVIVADNASTDGSLKVMQELFPHVRTLVFDRNLGFTGGYNQAFKMLYTDLSGEKKKDAPEYFLLINSDIEAPDGWLEPLVEWMDGHPECGACAPKLHSWQNRNMFEYAGAAGGYIDRFGYPFCRGRILSTIEEDKGQYDRPAEVFWATGACLMVRSGIYNELNGLDSRFFAHMEEIDLCWRMKLEGYSVNIVPNSVIWHVGGGTLPNNSPRKLFLNYRNNLLMLSNNLAKTYAVDKMETLLSEGYKATDRETMIEAAFQGITKANIKIFTRMVLDGMSAAVYLLTFKWSSFTAVVKAHGEFRKLRRKPDAPDIADFLKHNIKSNGNNISLKARINGIYPQWIIPQYFIKRQSLFGKILDWEIESTNKTSPMGKTI